MIVAALCANLRRLCHYKQPRGASRFESREERAPEACLVSDVSRNICHLCSPEQRHTINGNDQLLRALCLWTTITCVSPNTLQSPHPRLTRRHLCLACDASSSLDLLVSQHLDAATMIVDAPKNRHTVGWKRRQDGQQLLARSSSGATNAGSRTAALTSCCYNSFVASLVPLSTTPSSRITAYSTSLIDYEVLRGERLPVVPG